MFVIHGGEAVLCELDSKWDMVIVQTSWLLRPCSKPATTDENGIPTGGSRDPLGH